jgi:hypothetical protein
MPSATVAWIAVAIWSLSMIWIAVESGTQHDYKAYLLQWDLVLSSADPWSTDNAHGPLHNVLAYLLPLGPLAPKMLIVSTLLTANVLLISELYRYGGVSALYGVYLLSVPTNYLVISMAFAYGLNDALVAALIVFAVVARHLDRLIIAGCFIGLAILLKYYPSVLVPMFALDTGRVRFRLILAAAAVVLIGMAAATMVWGETFLRTVAFAAEREPKILSILSALSAYPSLVGGQSVINFLVQTNIEFVAVAGLLSFLIAWKMKMHWLEASVLGLLTVLVTYKVGHQQFYLPWLFLVDALPLAATPSSHWLARLCLPLVLFLSAFQWGYAYGTDGYNKVLGIIRQDVGFCAFGLSIATIVAYFLSRSRVGRRRITPLSVVQTEAGVPE